MVSGKLSLDIPEAKAKYALAKEALAQDIPMGLSIGYYTKKAEYADDDSDWYRKLLEIDLKEYSFVTFPANERAGVLSMKSIMQNLQLKQSDIQNNPRALEKVLREVGFSNSVSKKAASSAVKIAHTIVTSDNESLRDVDAEEVKETLEIFRMMRTQRELNNI